MGYYQVLRRICMPNFKRQIKIFITVHIGLTFESRSNRVGLIAHCTKYIMLGQVRLGQVRLGQVRLGQVRLGYCNLSPKQYFFKPKGYLQSFNQCTGTVQHVTRHAGLIRPGSGMIGSTQSQLGRENRFQTVLRLGFKRNFHLLFEGTTPLGLLTCPIKTILSQEQRFQSYGTLDPKRFWCSKSNISPKAVPWDIWTSEPVVKFNLRPFLFYEPTWLDERFRRKMEKTADFHVFNISLLRLGHNFFVPWNTGKCKVAKCMIIQGLSMPLLAPLNSRP